MPYAMKVQPIDIKDPLVSQPKSDATVKPVSKSRFKRLFERPFCNVLKTSLTEKPSGCTEPLNDCNKDGLEDLEPSSVCLAKMVQNFMEGSNEKQQRCGRNRCNCFNGACTEGSDDESDSYNSSPFDLLKSLVPCICVAERNLLADTAKIIEVNMIGSRKDSFCRKTVADGLTSLGYNASICKSKWEKSPTIPAGEYEYVDVIFEADRLIIDIDFRSEFEIARSTKAYKHVLQTLPTIFVGKPDRLEKIIAVVSEAARQSLKKKGMPLPPWRKADYVKAKWLSPFTRTLYSTPSSIIDVHNNPSNHKEADSVLTTHTSSCQEKPSPEEINGNNSGLIVPNINSSGSSPFETEGVNNWKPPAIKPKSLNKGKITTGLASVIDNKS